MWYVYDKDYAGYEAFSFSASNGMFTITPQTTMQEYTETLHPTPPANWHDVGNDTQPISFSVNNIMRVKTFMVNDWFYINIAKNDDVTGGRLFRIEVPNALFINALLPGVEINRTSTNSSYSFVEDIFFYRITTGAVSPLLLEGLTNMSDIGDIAIKSLNNSSEMMQLIFT